MSLSRPETVETPLDPVKLDNKNLIKPVKIPLSFVEERSTVQKSVEASLIGERSLFFFFLQTGMKPIKPRENRFNYVLSVSTDGKSI